MIALKKFGWLLVIRLSSTVNTLEVLILCGLGQDPSKKLNVVISKSTRMSEVIKGQDQLWRDLAWIENL
jgi:hypothetical protein